MPKPPYRQHRSPRSMYPVVDYSSSEEEEDASLRIKEAQQFKLLLQQVQVLNSQIEMFREKKLGSTKKQNNATYPIYSDTWQQSNVDDIKPYQRPRKLHKSANPAKQQRKAHKKSSSKSRQPSVTCEEEPPLLTYAQKAELSNLVNNDLSSEALQKVMELIKSAPGVASSFPDQDEIELDIEQMDRTTLWKLYQFVKNPNGDTADSPARTCGGGATHDPEPARKGRQSRRGRLSSNSAGDPSWSNQDPCAHPPADNAHDAGNPDLKQKDEPLDIPPGHGNAPWTGNTASSSSSDYTSDTDYDNYSETENA